MGKMYIDPKSGKIRESYTTVERFGTGIADFLGGGVDAFVAAGGVLLKFVAVAVVLFAVGWIVYILFADILLGYLGIVKAETPVTVSAAESVLAEDADIFVVSHQKEPKTDHFEIQDGQAVLKTSTRNQSFYLSYDGMLADSGFYLIPGITEPTSASAAFKTERVMLVSFRTEGGESIPTEQVQVSCSDTSQVHGILLQDGRFLFILPENASDLTFTFSADGYESVEVNEDWNTYRSGELEVCFRAS